MTSIVQAIRPMPSMRDDQSQLGKLRVGQSIEARVDSIGNDGSVRLLVAGMTLDIDLPLKLLQGQTVNLVVKTSSNGGLMLELKRPDFAEPALSSSTPPSPPSNSGAKGHGLLNALLDIGTVLIAGNPGASGSGGGKPANAGSIDHGEPLSAGDDTKAGTRTAQGTPANSGPIGNRVNLTLLHSPPTPRDGEELRGSPKAYNDAAAQNPAAPDQRAALPTTVINYVVPGTADRLQIAVTHEDDGANAKVRGEHKKSVRASFTVSSDALGQVHGVMRQHGAAISVALWAERPDIAVELRNERGELFDALGGAEVAVEALEVFDGAPPVASSRSAMPAESSVR